MNEQPQDAGSQDQAEQGLAQEINKIRDELHALRKETVAKACEITDLIDERDALQQDAERYRWLRGNFAVEILDTIWSEYDAFANPEALLDDLSWNDIVPPQKAKNP